MSTNTNERLYLFNRLETGQPLHLVFMSHNAHWAQAERLSERHDNCRVQVFGSGTAYLEMAKYSEWYEPIDDCDLIILRGSEYEKSELIKMKAIAHKISKEKEKPVTIGYSYLNHDYKPVCFDREHIIKTVKIDNEDEFEDSTKIIDMSPFDLINATLIMHDNQEKKLVKKK